MSRKALHTLVAVVGIAVAGGAAWWWQNRTDSPPSAAASVRVQGGSAGPASPAASGAPEAVTVEVGRVEVMSLNDEAQAVGSLRSRQGVVLRPEVSGRVAQLGFRDGERVKRGQVIVQLDDALQRAQLQQAKALASIARTNLQRNRELVAQNFVSKSAVDQTLSTLEVAEANVALAQAQLDRMQVRAPFDGIAGIRAVNIGDYVKDGADLVSVEDLSSMVVDFRLPERVMARLRIGQDVEVSFDGLPGRTYRANVDALDSLVDADGRSLLVRARLDNRDGALRSGMFARTRIVFSVRDKALVVPEEALVPQGGKQHLVKLVESPQGGKVTQRIEARIGMRVPGKVEILQGVQAGDQVVTAGQSRVMARDGIRVKVVEIVTPSPGVDADAGVPASPRTAPAV
jgi:membrane fusion protein (multidrug efflux system)